MEPVLFDTWYASLFEALNWSVALDDRLKRDWIAEADWTTEINGGETIRAFRFARNSVHHEWAEAFMPIDGAKIIEPWVTVLSLEWRDELQCDRPDRIGQVAYETHLAGQGVGDSLLAMSDTFGRAIRLLRELHWSLHQMHVKAQARRNAQAPPDSSDIS
jgi:hypothetical protein